MRHVRFTSQDRQQVQIGNLQDNVIQTDKQRYRLSDVQLLAPVIPTKIICLAGNYVEHFQESRKSVSRRPNFFLKPPSAIIGPGDTIILPKSGRVDYEGELAVVIGRRCRNVSAAAAYEVVAGYTCMNDVSDREAQEWEANWVRGKAFDTSAPLGPVLVSLDELTEPLRIIVRLNGRVVQDGSTRDMVFSIPEIIAELSSFMTLEPGDVIATGTPPGVGPVSPGDIVNVEIEGIGTLSNPVGSPPHLFDGKQPTVE